MHGSPLHCMHHIVLHLRGLRCTAPNWIALHRIVPHSTASPCVALHSAALPPTTLRPVAQHCMCCAALRCPAHTAFLRTVLCCTTCTAFVAQRRTDPYTLHCSTQHCIAPRCTALCCLAPRYCPAPLRRRLYCGAPRSPASTALRCLAALQNAARRCLALHSAARRCIAPPVTFTSPARPLPHPSPLGEPRPIRSARRLRPTLSRAPRSPIGGDRYRRRCLHGDAAEGQSKMAAEPGGGCPWSYRRYRPLLAAFTAALLLGCGRAAALSPFSSSSCHHRVPSGKEVGPPRGLLRRRRGARDPPFPAPVMGGSVGLSPHG